MEKLKTIQGVKDKKADKYWGKIIEGADPKSFKFLDSPSGEASIYNTTGDNGNIYVV